MRWCLVPLLLVPCLAAAQEASRGAELRGTVSAQGVLSSLSTEAPRNGSPATAGYRAVLYPTFKMSEHWSVTGALQSASRPYFRDALGTAGYGITDYVLQGSLNYARVSDSGLLQVRAGQLSTAFGTFLLRYDDAENPLTQVPLQYGYYNAVGLKGVLGVQVDAARGKWDGRVQFANSSPANPRSAFGPDQYGNWAGGIGYTPRQGLHVGASAYAGPYLDRKGPFYFPGEASPAKLDAHAWGIDADWTRGYWTVRGEVQSFYFPYTAIPDFKEKAGYVETRRTLSPRWSAAARAGYLIAGDGHSESIEAAATYRPNRLQMIKAGYEWQPRSDAPNAHTFAVQLVTSLKLFSIARR